MPNIKNSSYIPKSIISRNAHLSTLYSGVFKSFDVPNYQREKHELPDGDFLLLDWLLQPQKNKIVIISHGLEGNSRRTYMNSCADYFFKNGYSVLSWNQRSCGGEMNRLFRLYHHGLYDDLEYLISEVVKYGYKEVYLIGYSLGGAQTLNYLGKTNVHPLVKGAIAVSAPLDLKSSVHSLKKFPNTFYMYNFIRELVPKLKQKAKQFPGKFPTEKLKFVTSFDLIDDYFTAPMHGFNDKDDYYTKASPLPHLQNIKTSTLIINSWDDPFIDTKCYPVNQLKNSKFVYFETPKYGGHCSFLLEKSKYSWVEIRAFEFFEKNNFII